MSSPQDFKTTFKSNLTCIFLPVRTKIKKKTICPRTLCCKVEQEFWWAGLEKQTSERNEIRFHTAANVKKMPEGTIFQPPKDPCTATHLLVIYTCLKDKGGPICVNSDRSSNCSRDPIGTNS